MDAWIVIVFHSIIRFWKWICEYQIKNGMKTIGIDDMNKKKSDCINPDYFRKDGN